MTFRTRKPVNSFATFNANYHKNHSQILYIAVKNLSNPGQLLTSSSHIDSFLPAYLSALAVETVAPLGKTAYLTRVLLST